MTPHNDQTSEFVSRLVKAQPRLRSYIRMMVFNPSDVSDIMQEVAAAGWSDYGKYDPARPFEAWLMGIARNRVCEYLRDQKKRASPLNIEVLEVLESEAAELSETTSQLEDALESCLGKLPSDDYKMVRTRFEETDSNRAASKRLGISESKISRALNRIYARLMICIKREQRGLGVQP